MAALHSKANSNYWQQTADLNLETPHVLANLKCARAQSKRWAIDFAEPKFFVHPASPKGATKQVQLTQQRHRPTPSHKRGRVWSTSLDGVGTIAFCNSLRKWLQDDQQGIKIRLKLDLFTKHKINCVDSLWSLKSFSFC